MMEIDGLRRHDVDAFGTRIHVAEVGEGPIVLFVHGFPSRGTRGGTNSRR